MIINYKQITTERLLLRLPVPGNYTEHFNYQSSKENFPDVDLKEMLNIEEVKDYFNKMEKGVNEKKWLFWVIADKLTNKAYGTVSVWNIDYENKSGEYGYCLYQNSRGNGYMLETLKAVNNYCFNTLGFEILYAFTHNNNKPSKKLLEKAKFQYIKTINEKGHYINEIMPYAVFELRKKL